MDIKISICLLLVSFGSSLCSQSGEKGEKATGVQNRASGPASLASGISFGRSGSTGGPTSRQNSIKSEELARSVSNVKIKEEGEEKGKEKAKEVEIPPWKELVDLIARRTQSLALKKLKEKPKATWRNPEASQTIQSTSMAAFIKNCAVGYGGQDRFMTTEDRQHTFEFELLPFTSLTDETKIVLASMSKKSEEFVTRDTLECNKLVLIAKSIRERQGEHIVGFAKIETGQDRRAYYVECVSVEPEFRPYKIASTLVNIVEETVRKIASEAHLTGKVYTYGVDPNTDEMEAYKSNNFKESKDTKGRSDFEKAFNFGRLKELERQEPQPTRTPNLDWL